MKKIISVNRQALARGEPAISIKAGGKTYAVSEVDIVGPSRVVEDPAKKQQPRVWIETKSLLMVDGEVLVFERNGHRAT